MGLMVSDAEHHLSQDGPSSPVGAERFASRGAHTPRLLATIFQTLLIQPVPQGTLRLSPVSSLEELCLFPSPA